MVSLVGLSCAPEVSIWGQWCVDQRQKYVDARCRVRTVLHLGQQPVRPVSELWGKHDDVIKWKHFPRYWPFVRGIHRSPVNSPHKGQWRGALMISLIWVWINGWVNNREAGDLRRYRGHYDVIVMKIEMWARVCPINAWIVASKGQ